MVTDLAKGMIAAVSAQVTVMDIMRAAPVLKWTVIDFAIWYVSAIVRCTRRTAAAQAAWALIPF